MPGLHKQYKSTISNRISILLWLQSVHNHNKFYILEEKTEKKVITESYKIAKMILTALTASYILLGDRLRDNMGLSFL